MTAAPRRDLLIVGAVVLTISIGAFFRVPLLPSIGAELSMTAGQLGLITTVFAIGRLLTDIPAGRLADRTPPLRSLGVAGAVLAVGSLGVATARTSGAVIAFALLLGVASAISNTTGMTYFSTAAPAARRGTSMAGFSAALLGGQALGPMIGGAIGGAAGWRIAISSAAAVGGTVAIVGLVSHHVGRGGVRPAGTGRDAARSGSRSSNRTPIVQRLVLYAVSFSSFFMLGAMPQTLVPIIGADRHGLAPAVIGLALGIGGGCRFIGAMVGGRLADRVSRKASLIPGMILGSIGIAVLALDAGTAGWVSSIVLLSLGSYGVSVAATMLADHAAGTSVGRQLGTYRFIGDLGLIAGPVVAGVLYERVSDDAAVLAVAALLGTVTVLCALLLHETRWLEEPDRSATRTRRNR